MSRLSYTGGVMRAAAAIPLLLLASGLGAGCAARFEVVERTTRGPLAQEILVARSYEMNGRAPNFDEKRYWDNQIDSRIAQYLREHPELQQTERFSEFRFWKQVTPASSREEVRILLETPEEQTIDPALMAALAERHWPDIRSKAKEAWLYPLGWVLYFDDAGVVEMVRRVSSLAPPDD